MSQSRVSGPPLIPGFTYLKDLGRGGYSHVYLYERHLPRRHVAVKVMNGDVGEEETAAFESEANRMAMLSSHPAILSVYEAGVTEDGRPFIVTEYCPPPHLGAILAQGPMSIIDSLTTTIQIAGAVETAHRVRIIHRDIKPSNILMTAYHRPVLSDFGISAMTGRGASADLRGMSIPWAPPEQLSGTGGAHPGVDVYSLAASMYAMLSGHSPFEVPGGSNGIYEVSRRIINNPVPQIEREDIPPSLFRILTIALSKNPENRYPSALAFARALQQVEAELGVNVTPVDLLRSSTESDLIAAPPPEEDTDEATRIGVFRRIDEDEEEPVQPEPVAAEAVGEQPVKKKTSWAWGVLVAILAVLVIASTFWWAQSQTMDDLSPGGVQPADPLSTSIAEPRDVHGVLEGDDVVFTWSPPSDDWQGKYLYREDLPGTDTTFQTLFEPTVTIGKRPGRTCIEVVAVRSDGRSSKSVSICTDTP